MNDKSFASDLISGAILGYVVIDNANQAAEDRAALRAAGLMTAAERKAEWHAPERKHGRRKQLLAYVAVLAAIFAYHLIKTGF